MDVWGRIDGGHFANTTLEFQTTSTAGPDPQQATPGTGNGFASFLVGVGSGKDQTGFNKFPATDKHLLGWYVQDTWKTTSKLTLTLGLRYEIQTAPTERHNAQQYFNFTATLPLQTPSAPRLDLMFRVNWFSIQTATEASTIPPTPILRPASAPLISCATNLCCAAAMASSSSPTTMAQDPTSASRKALRGSPLLMVV